MQVKKSLIALLAAFCLSIFAFGTVRAQDCGSTCQPSVSPMGMINFGCNKKVFTVNTSRQAPCEIVDYMWTVSGPYSSSIINAGGQAMITFNGPGTYTVCVEFIVGYDFDGMDGIEPDEQCSVSTCKYDVTIPAC